MFFHEISLCTNCVIIEYLSVFINHALQLSCGRVETVNIVAFVFEASQQIEERWSDFHTFGHESILARAFEIENSDTLLGVRFMTQIDVIIDRLCERFESVGDCLNRRKPIVISEVGEKSVRTHCTVNLRRNNALRKEAAAHTHFVVKPFIVVAIDVERGKENDIVGCEIVANAVAHSSVGQIDDRCGADGVGVGAVDEQLD